MNSTLKFIIITLITTHLSFASSKKKPASTPAPTIGISQETQLSKHHEVLLNVGDFSQNDFSDATLSFNNQTRISFGGAYYYRLNHFLEVGPRLSIAYINLGVTNLTTFEFLGSGRISFPFNEEFENSFFGGAILGLGTVSAASISQTTAIFGFEAGKRFMLFPNFTWQPTVAVTVPTNSSYGSVSIAFRLLSASLVF